MTETLLRGAAAAAPYLDEIDETLVCTEIVDITHDVKSFTFGPPRPGGLRFLPGQYLTFRFRIDGNAIERCYTISSAPTLPDRVTITVKRVPGGPVSNWLHDTLAVGDAVHATGPFGEFSTAYHPAPKYLFLSAGSGITPLMSMTRTLRDRADPADVVFVHCARTPDDIVFRQELDHLATRPETTVAVVCEDDSPDERWSGARGRLTLAMLLTLVPDLLDREVFSCGPPAYMECVRGLLDLAGTDPARRHEESFTLGALTEEFAEQQASTSTYQVELRRSGRTVECDGATPVLAAAARAGVPLPSSCGEGVCGTCKSALVDGSVDMRHAGGIRQREVDAGKILICCSTPLTDLVIDA